MIRLILPTLAVFAAGAAIAAGPTIDRAVAAVGDAGTRLATNLASNASPSGLGITRR